MSRLVNAAFQVLCDENENCNQQACEQETPGTRPAPQASTPAPEPNGATPETNGPEAQNNTKVMFGQ